MRILMLAAVILLVVLTAVTGNTDVNLVDNGRTDYCIIVAKDASPSEHWAASEFQKFTMQMSGAMIPYSPDSDVCPEKAVLIGDSKALRSLGINIDFKDLDDEGYAIKTVGSRLIIAGGRLRGTMYGVYGFLDSLGCKWLSTKVSKIPKLDNISLSNIDKTDKPAYEYRAIHICDVFDADFCARNRINGLRSLPMDAKHGGCISYFPYSHSFSLLVPVDQYWATHPEYFAMLDGKRTMDKTQLCMSNPEVLKIATQTVLQWMHDHPDVKVFSVVHNDNHNYCQCTECKKIYEEEGSQSGLLLRFVNAIAAETEKVYLDKIIDTLAYQWTEKSPKITKPRDNVRVTLCPISCCEAHPYEKCDYPDNKAFLENLANWTKITNNLYIWHYNTDFSYYLTPFPDYRQFMDSVKLYKKAGIKGIFWEGNYNGGMGEMGELRSYMLAKLSWNPDIDGNAVMKEFCDDYYGKSGVYIIQYINLLEDKVTKDNIHFRIWTKPNAPYLSPDIIAKSDALFAKAKSAADSSEILDRVNRAYLSLEYVKLIQPILEKQTKGMEQEYIKQLNEFMEKCRHYGVTRIKERKTLDAFYAETMKKLGG